MRNVALVLLMAVAACGDDAGGLGTEAAPSHCGAEAPLGSGAFGCWFSDDYGLPAYEYTMALDDPRRQTFTYIDFGIADDHWHQLGNRRLTAMAHADGRVRVFDATRGPKWVSEYSHYRLAVDGREADPSARRLVFGAGYVETAQTAGDVSASRSVFAPWGDEAELPALIIEHTLVNIGNRDRDVRITELWDAQMRQLGIQLAYTLGHEGAEEQRLEQMQQFEQLARFDADRDAVLIDTRALTSPVPPPSEAADTDFHTGTLALVSLDGPPDDFALAKRTDCNDCEPATLPTVSGATARVGPPPFGMLRDGATSAGPALASDGAFAAELRRTITVPAGETRSVRFAVVYAADSEVTGVVDGLRAAPPTLATSAAAVAARTVRWQLPEGDAVNAAISREMAWHSYYFLSAANYEEYYGVHNVDQGSAYGYLQGLRGAARDSLINAVAAIHVDPELAREQILYVMQTTEPDSGRISYGTGNYGELTDAIIHTKPSDLSLWMLWAIVEYVEATRDLAFLDESVAYYPPTAGVTATVRERIAGDLAWLMNDIGVGEHGMLKVGSGDWSDGISFLSPDRDILHTDGESTFNTAFAAYVFPRVAELVTDSDATLAQQFTTAADSFAAALASQYNGQWFYRAWDGQGGTIGDEHLFLEHHTWLLIGDVPSASQRNSVIANIDTTLAADSAIGSWLLYPPIESGALTDGWDVNGGIWAAMNGLLVWGLSRTDPDRAWDELIANSMTRHAEQYPDMWYGIWSGPDAYNASYAERPGETFWHFATPMTDFPLCNSNRHALPLIDAVKLSGIEYDAAGVRIDPRLPFETFSLATPLIELSYEVNAVSGRVRFASPGDVTVQLPAALAGASSVTVTIDGTAQTIPIKSGSVRFAVAAGDVGFAIAP